MLLSLSTTGRVSNTTEVAKTAGSGWGWETIGMRRTSGRVECSRNVPDYH